MKKAKITFFETVDFDKKVESKLKECLETNISNEIIIDIKLSEALQIIKDEYRKHYHCENCPFAKAAPNNSDELDDYICAIMTNPPDNWEIKSIDVIRLLESE